MSPAADFVRAEIKNVQEALDETLRHEYGGESRSEYYAECRHRLDVIQERLALTSSTDYKGLVALTMSLSELSATISRIERSRLGEFSWPFADELRALVNPLCQEDPENAETLPILHILSDGSLLSYAIHPESVKRGLFVRRRIINIVFPRTLKHYVLYHSLLGHEVGHAVRRTQRHEAILRHRVPGYFKAKGPLRNAYAAAHWVSESRASSEVNSVRENFRINFPHLLSVFPQQLEMWLEEFMCDLFGLIMMGPAFLLAHSSLLPRVGYPPSRWGDRHPPHACRAYLLSRAWSLLGWKPPKLKRRWASKAVDHMLRQALTVPSNHPWVRVFDDEQIERAVSAIARLLGPQRYTPPQTSELDRLVDMLSQRVPPCGAGITSKGEPENRRVDFRYILYAGWIYWWAIDCKFLAIDTNVFDDERLLLKVNRLCEQGLVQQQAIDLSLQGDTSVKS